MKVGLLTGYFSFMFKSKRKTKTYDFVVGVVCLLWLTSCQPSTPSVQTIAERAPFQDRPAPQLRQADVVDVVGDLIDQVEEESGEHVCDTES